MRKLSLKISALITGLTAFLITTPVFAEGDNCVETTFFGRKCGSDGIIEVLYVVINVLSACVVVLAILGIVISGIQYLTASGNEEQLKKSKRRIFEIIIGIAAYALIYGFLNWLLPNFPK